MARLQASLFALLDLDLDLERSALPTGHGCLRLSEFQPGIAEHPLTTGALSQIFCEDILWVQTLEDVVNFYDIRFGIGFSPLQKKDLVNFLNAL